MLQALFRRPQPLGERLAAATLVLVMGGVQTAPVVLLNPFVTHLISCVAAYNQERQQIPPPVPQGDSVSTPTPVYQDNFTSLDISTPSHQGAWRPNDTWQPLGRGYTDFGAGGSTYNLDPSAGHGNPFAIVDDKDATDGKALEITASRMTQDQKNATGVGCPWAGGILISNSDVRSFGYGYFEFRMKMSQWGQGGFPALWLYAASGKNSNAGGSNKGGAEIDLLEIFGYGNAQPWTTTLHTATNNNGPSAIGDQVVGAHQNDTRDGYHTYGIDWAADRMDFYRDGTKVGSASAAMVKWFAGLKMDVRLNVAMDASWFPGAQRSTSATTAVKMRVDYFRHWASRQDALDASAAGTGTTTPPVVVPPVTTKPPTVDYNDQAVRLPLVGASAPRPQASDHICDAVATLLTLRGFDTPATGTWTATHVNNVKAFQKAKGLSADGLVGSATWARLLYS